MIAIKSRLLGVSLALGAAVTAACSSGATIGPSPVRTATPEPSTSASVAPTGMPTIVTGPSKAPGTAPPTTTPTMTPVPSAVPSTSSTTLPAGPKIYVANHGKDGSGYNPSVTIYSATASGNVAPLATLSGAFTGEAQIQYPAVDPAGNLYLTDQGATGGSTAGTLKRFLATKLSGNQPPDITIGGLDAPEGVAFDSSGDVYVATENSIDIYPPNPTASSQPMATIAGSNTGLFAPYGIFVDATNKIYVAESDAVEVFAAGATGNATPIQEFDTPDDMLDALNSALSIAADASGNIYVANFNNSTITEYSAGSTGTSVTPSNIATDPTHASIFEPYGIFVDSAGILYVANYGNSSVAFGSAATLTAFPATATVITGTATNLNSPYGLYVR